ncbi:MAG: hypothetical protein L0H29_06930, partial [Sinobacteraceae bacterium]|nr:hypothetical protein [Nevskiaceae bacterium]
LPLTAGDKSALLWRDGGRDHKRPASFNAELELGVPQAPPSAPRKAGYEPIILMLQRANNQLDHYNSMGHKNGEDVFSHYLETKTVMVKL